METMMIGYCQRCRKSVTDWTCDSNCLASHHSNAKRPAIPTSNRGRIRRHLVLTVPLSTKTMLLPTKKGISTHSAVRYWCSKRSTASGVMPRNRENHRSAWSP
jgi:hypothetical protein